MNEDKMKAIKRYIPKETVEVILELLSQGVKQSDIAKRFDISQTGVSAIKRRYILKSDPGVPIPGFPEYYIDKEGRVYSEKKRDYLKPRYEGRYTYVTLFKGERKRSIPSAGRSKKVLLNLTKLVASTFVKNPHKLDSVIHKDGDLTNNSSSNLRWVNRKTAFNLGKEQLKSE